MNFFRRLFDMTLRSEVFRLAVNIFKRALIRRVEASDDIPAELKPEIKVIIIQAGEEANKDA